MLQVGDLNLLSSKILVTTLPSKLYASTAVLSLIGTFHAVSDFARRAALALGLEVAALRDGFRPAAPVAHHVRGARKKDL